VSPNSPVIPHSRPTIDAADVRAVTEVLRSGHLAQGGMVQRFEEELAPFLGRRGGVATSSGTAALHLALLVLGVGAGDEVLLPSYTCVALLHAVNYVGATPIVADIRLDDYNLSPSEVRRRITSRTKAIIVPHMFGMSVDLEPILSCGVPLIEDCAQALGAAYRGRPVGSYGTISVCSFYATKVITTGEGGMLLSDSEVVLERAREFRDYDGRVVHQTRFNYKMTEMEAALGLSQLRRLASFVARRRDLASQFTARLRHLPVRLPTVKPDRSHIFYRYVIGIGDAQSLEGRLGGRGVQCKAPVFQPLHRYLGRDGFAETEMAMRTALSIPIYPSLTDDEVERIVRSVAEEVEREEERSRRVLSLHS
jgi:perosamine synthetase